MEYKNDGCAGDEMVTVIDIYSRRPDGSIDHRRLLDCAGCTATHDSPSECPCDRCMEGRHE